MRGAAFYILSVTAAAILVAILRALAGQGTSAGLIRLLGGIFMALTVISPVLDIELPDFQAWFSQYAAAGEAAAAEGAAMGDAARQAIISDQLEAYIQDKAASLGETVTAEVHPDPDGTPGTVVISGSISPQTRQALSEWLETTLEIGEEAVQWIGNE